MDVNSSGCYISADQQPHLFPLKTQEDLLMPAEAALKKVSLIYFSTLKHSKLFFLSLGLRSPWRQTQENWWLLLLGPRNNGGIMN